MEKEQAGASFGPGSREPSPSVSAFGFDPSREAARGGPAVIGIPMLVQNAGTKAWHVLSEDGQQFDLVPAGRLSELEAEVSCLRERLEDKISAMRVEVSAKQTAYREIRELEAENERLKEALRKEATSLDVEASRWLPGLTINLRNPYAHQMHRAFTAAASRLRAVLSPPQSCPEVARIIAESNRDTDYSPV